jgi:4-aminobutyrate aminotransferase
VWWKSTDLTVVRGSGMYLHTSDGREILDFSSGVGVTSTGHSHPDLVAALHEQMKRVMHAQVNLVNHDRLGPASEALNSITPASIDTFFFANSGAEAVEAAVKLARHATGKQNLIVFERGFHGRTAQTMAMTTSKASYRAGYAPLPAGIHVAPTPYPIRTGETPEAAAQRCLQALDWMLGSITAPSETAALVLETIIGEGGYLVPSQEFMRGLRELCTRHGILLILDEIQCGVGRSGKWFAFEHYGIEPDILVLGKGIGSGFPVSCIGASADLMSRWGRGSHGGTYGGNPVGCTAITATLEIIERERLLANAGARGAQLLDELTTQLKANPHVVEVRGLGLMVGIEVVDDQGRPDGARATAVVRACLDEDILIPTCGLDGNVIRLIPALTVSAAEVTRVVDALTRHLAR